MIFYYHIVFKNLYYKFLNLKHLDTIVPGICYNEFTVARNAHTHIYTLHTTLHRSVKDKYYERKISITFCV